MTFISHTLVGIATAKLATLVAGVPVGWEFLVVSGALANLPDADMLWKRSLLTHHNDWTHYPVIALAFLMAALLLVKLAYVPLLVVVFAVNWVVHLMLDLFGVRVGLHLLWPLGRGVDVGVEHIAGSGDLPDAALRPGLIDGGSRAGLGDNLGLKFGSNLLLSFGSGGKSLLLGLRTYRFHREFSITRLDKSAVGLCGVFLAALRNGEFFAEFVCCVFGLVVILGV